MRTTCSRWMSCKNRDRDLAADQAATVRTSYCMACRYMGNYSALDDHITTKINKIELDDDDIINC